MLMALPERQVTCIAVSHCRATDRCCTRVSWAGDAVQVKELARPLTHHDVQIPYRHFVSGGTMAPANKGAGD